MIARGFLGIFFLCLTITGCNYRDFVHERYEFGSDLFRTLTPHDLRYPKHYNLPTGTYTYLPQDPDRWQSYYEKGLEIHGDRVYMARDGNDSYGEGHADGCETVLGVLDEGLARFNRPRFFPDKLIKDKWYLRGFRDGTAYCVNRTDWEIH